MRRHLDAGRSRGDFRRLRRRGPDAGGGGIPGTDLGLPCVPPPPRSATRSNLFPGQSGTGGDGSRGGRLFAPLEATEAAMTRELRAGAGDLLGSLARRGAGGGRGSVGGSDATPTAGRPVVVVTGMGVMTSLGAGQGGQLARTDRRAFRHPPHLAFPDRRLAHQRSPAPSISSPVEELSAPALSERLAELVIEEALAEAGSAAGRLSRPDVPRAAAGGNGMAAAAGARRRLRSERKRQLRRPAARRRQREVRRYYDRFLFSSVGRKSGRRGSAPRVRRSPLRPRAPRAPPRSSWA